MSDFFANASEGCQRRLFTDFGLDLEIELPGAVSSKADDTPDISHATTSFDGSPPKPSIYYYFTMFELRRP